MLQVIDATIKLYEATHHAAKRKTLGPIERKLEKAMAKAFHEQGKVFVKGFVKFKDQFPAQKSESSRSMPWHRLREVLVADDLDKIFDDSEGDSFEAFVTPLTDAVTASLLAAGLQQIAELGLDISFSLKNPRAVAYVKAHGAEMVKGVNETTRAFIKSLIDKQVSEGSSYIETARALVAKYDEFAVGVPGSFSSRAERIAVTEAGNAYEEGNWEPIADLMDSGIQMEKSWDINPELTKTGTCLLICQPNADEGWIPADQQHQSGHDHPLGHVGCVCDEFYRAKGA